MFCLYVFVVVVVCLFVFHWKNYTSATRFYFVWRVSALVGPVFISFSWCLLQRIMHVFSSLEEYLHLKIMSSCCKVDAGCYEESWRSSVRWKNVWRCGSCLHFGQLMPATENPACLQFAGKIYVSVGPIFLPMTRFLVLDTQSSTIGCMSDYEHPIFTPGGCLPMSTPSSYRRVDVCLWTSTLDTVGWMSDYEYPVFIPAGGCLPMNSQS